jgi:hypothetical protein
MKVMRDEDGEFIRNGHLLGFFRRICRLLFNKIRPIFVFDGATPVLKRLTVTARRQRRETQGVQVCHPLLHISQLHPNSHWFGSVRTDCWECEATHGRLVLRNVQPWPFVVSPPSAHPGLATTPIGLESKSNEDSTDNVGNCSGQLVECPSNKPIV